MGHITGVHESDDDARAAEPEPAADSKPARQEQEVTSVEPLAPAVLELAGQEVQVAPSP